MSKILPHSCHCQVVHTCPIMTHPDAAVQATLAQLSEEIARYDDTTGSKSTLQLISLRPDGGSFTSVTAPAKPWSPGLCTRCKKSITGSFVGDGDGTGQKFAHYDCYFIDRYDNAL